MLTSCPSCGKQVSIRALSCPHCGETNAPYSSCLFIGNLSCNVTASDLVALFRPHGTVRHASVIIDRDTGRPMGYGFVEMSSVEEARVAFAALDGQEVDGQQLIVGDRRPRG